MNSAPQRPQLSREGFLQALSRSRLFTTERLTVLAAELPAAPARDLADRLVSTEELTHYQAEKLLHGRWQGLVLGSYHVLAPLGKGGMGTVYLARFVGHKADDPARPWYMDAVEAARQSEGTAPAPPSSLVALKVLPAKKAREEERMLHRFRREMELGRVVSHTNVTRTLDAGEAAGVHYIAMEYVPGHTLSQLVGTGGPLAPADAARVFSDVVAGLAHAHAAGLIHRDLKPSNIMVTPEGQGKVLDFGLAMLMGEALPDDPSIVGGKGYILGTMDYIAPEQSQNATDVGPWSDLYAVGCSLYYALTGAPPFPGGSSKQKIRWHRTEEPPPVNLINPAVPTEFARLVEQLMSKQPADRPQDAEAIRRQLLAWAGGSVPGAGPHTVKDVLAEVNTRQLDPSLWDATPLPAADTPDTSPEAPKPSRKPRRPEPAPLELDDAEPREPVNWTPWILGGLAAAPVVLVLLFLAFYLLTRLF